MNPESEEEAKQKLIDRLLDLWMHQNELLWGRLQTIAAIQVGVIGGWYFLTFSEKNPFALFLAFGLTVLGFILSREVRELIECDLDHRWHYHEHLKTLLGKEFFKERGGTHGYIRLRRISRLFIWINGTLALFSGGWFSFNVLKWLVCICGC